MPVCVTRTFVKKGWQRRCREPEGTKIMCRHFLAAISAGVLMSFPVSHAAGPATDNRLANPGFEEGDPGETVRGWTKLSYDGSKKDANFRFAAVEGGREGGRKAVLAKNGKQWALVEQFIPVELKDGYSAVFSVWMRSDQTAPRVGVHLYLMRRDEVEGGLYNSRSEVAVGHEWKRYEIELPLVPMPTVAEPGSCRLRPIVQLHSSVSLELDDATLEIVKAEASSQRTAEVETIREMYADDVPYMKSPFGFFGAILSRPDGRLLAFSADFHMMASADGGKSWGGKSKLAITDPFDKVTGAVAMSDGSVGIHTESWSKPLYFWKSSDEGKSWSKRVQIAEKGAPYHGNVMIELAPNCAGMRVPGWSKCTKSKTPDVPDNDPESRSSFAQVAGGRDGERTAALVLHESDQWIYAMTWVRPKRTLRTGDEYVFRVAAKTASKAHFDLYAEAWNGKADKGSTGRKRFEAGVEWQEYAVNLRVTEPADGLPAFRVVVQLYTQDVRFLFDDARVERAVPADDAGALSVRNASFEGVRVGRLLIPVRQGYAFSGGAASSDYMAGGIDVRGNRIYIEGHGQLAEMCISYVCYSDDGGESWQRSHPVFIWQDDGYGGIGMADEPNVAELTDGRVIMFMRNPLGRIYQTFSADSGQTWEYPTPTVLPSSLSPCCVERVPANEHTLASGRAGDLLCVWNNVSDDEIRRGFRRGRLSAAISKDDGKTWINARTIDTAGLPALSGMAPLSPPGFVRADRDLGQLPLPIGFVDYPDITFLGERVLVKYAKKLKNPPLGTSVRIRTFPLDWFYGNPRE